MQPALAQNGKITLVIHGGAGTILKKNMTAVAEAAYREALTLALNTGFAVLEKNGSSLDAVEATLRVMEDSPLFNAGKGAVFTHDGRNELDASIMNGATKSAGAVGGVTIIRNPISAARAVMEKSPHVMMTGRGAELFATSAGLEIVDPSYFWTERRWKALQDILVREKETSAAWDIAKSEDETRFGTVGAVALDSQGNLAAATSTGGMTNKRFGRVGDSPIIGAGTWADNDSCAVSATGDGEYFIRLAVARDIAALVEYKGMTVEKASAEVIHGKLTALGGEGGVIVLDRKGNFAMVFNSEGMYRGSITAAGAAKVEIYK
ncbi:MAG TPA: isoaspartyl peptidase/L-asparaginase [Thermoanaerobaculia bacterium]|nr:isoaspartyl peptidase/L-asparaginase [Thermoanaerobaculia bacterium]